MARAVATGWFPKIYFGRYLEHRARTCSILIMTKNGVVKAAGFRRMSVDNFWNVDSWGVLRGLPSGFY